MYQGRQRELTTDEFLGLFIKAELNAALCLVTRVKK